MDSTFVAQRFEFSKKFCIIVNLFWGCLVLIIFLNAWAASIANLIFNGPSRKYLDKQSTAVRRYFILRLFFTSLSMYAQSRDQITLTFFYKKFEP